MPSPVTLLATWIAPTVIAAGDHRRGHDVAGRGSRSSCRAPAGSGGPPDRPITIVVRLLLGDVADEPGADRHLGADQRARPAAHREAAAEHVALGDPDRAALGAERGEHPVEHPGQQLVEIEGRAELQADGMEQAQTLDFLAEFVGRRRRCAHVG